MKVSTESELQDKKDKYNLWGYLLSCRDKDETVGLIETVEKAARLYVFIVHLPYINTILGDELKAAAYSFGLEYRKDFLNF